jgi:N utilization substance protein B
MAYLNSRHLSRRFALQGVYYYQLNPTAIDTIEQFLFNSYPKLYQQANYNLLHFLLEHGTTQYDAMLHLYSGLSDRQLNQINLLESSILVIAAVELVDNHSVPTTVIINEAVELAKVYCAHDSYKFINRLVDTVARNIRKV